MEKCSSLVAILLATYNGEKYITQQLQSIANQTCKDVAVYVHDDGSTDDTLAIVKSFEEKTDLKIVVLDDDRSRGPRDSFMWLLEHVDARYYMFCDQDDVWLPQKVEKSIAKLQTIEAKHTKTMPCMIHSDLRVVDASLNTIHESMWELWQMDVKLMRRLPYLAIKNVFTGCTMAINRAARDKSLEGYQYAHMHDHWVGMVVAKYGVIDCVPERLMLYRQHGGNVVSAGEGEGQSQRGVLKKMLDIVPMYDANEKAFKILGLSRWKAMLYKFLYALQLRGIAPGYRPYKVVIDK